MRQRCEKPDCSGYWKYGAKGIRVCDEWKVFENFMEWAYANGYSDDLSIDRIDPNGNYDPANCRWVTQKVQQNNRSNNIHITYNGETHNIEEWSKITGLPIRVIYDRNHRGWPVERIFGQKKRKTPVRNDNKKSSKTSSLRIYYDESENEKMIIALAAMAMHDDSFTERLAGKYGRKDATSYELGNGMKILAWGNQTGIVLDFRKKSIDEMPHDRRPEDRR